MANVGLQDFLSGAASVAVGSLLGKNQAEAENYARQQQAAQEQRQQQELLLRQAEQRRQAEKDALDYFEKGRSIVEAGDPALEEQEKAVRAALGQMEPASQQRALSWLQGVEHARSQRQAAMGTAFRGLPGVPASVAGMFDQGNQPPPSMDFTGGSTAPAPASPPQLQLPRMAMGQHELQPTAPTPFPRPGAPAAAAGVPSPPSPAAAPSQIPQAPPGGKLTYLPGVGLTPVYDPAAGKSLARDVQARMRLISGITDPNLKAQAKQILGTLKGPVNDLATAKAASDFLAATEGFVPGGSISAQRFAASQATAAQRAKATATSRAASEGNRWARLAATATRGLAGLPVTAGQQRALDFYMGQMNQLGPSDPRFIKAAQQYVDIVDRKVLPAAKSLKAKNDLAEKQRQQAARAAERLREERERQAAAAARQQRSFAERESLQRSSQQFQQQQQQRRQAAKGAGKGAAAGNRMDPIDARQWAAAEKILAIPPKKRTEDGLVDEPRYNLGRAKAAARKLVGLNEKYGRDPSYLYAQYPELVQKAAPKSAAPVRTAAPTRASAPAPVSARLTRLATPFRTTLPPGIDASSVPAQVEAFNHEGTHAWIAGGWHPFQWVGGQFRLVDPKTGQPFPASQSKSAAPAKSAAYYQNLLRRAPGPPITPEMVEGVRHAIRSGTFEQTMQSPAMQNPILRQQAKAVFEYLLHTPYSPKPLPKR